MASNTSLDGLIRWLGRDEWRERFDEVLWLHLGPACERAGIETGESAGVVGPHMAMTLWGCTFEDFLTRTIDQDAPGQDGRNIVDDYLKRRGWKEPVPARRYMQGLRQSVMSLYEVRGIVPGASFLARDLLRGGEPVLVTERTATQTLAPWERIGARLVAIGNQTIMGGGVLPFSFESAEAVQKVLKASMRRVRRGLGRNTAELDIPEAANVAAGIPDDLLLAGLAPVFSTAWLEDALSRAMNPTLPALTNSEGDEIAFYTVRYPLFPGAKPGQVSAASIAVAAAASTAWRRCGLRPARCWTALGVSKTWGATPQAGSLGGQTVLPALRP